MIRENKPQFVEAVNMIVDTFHRKVINFIREIL